MYVCSLSLSLSRNQRKNYEYVTFIPPSLGTDTKHILADHGNICHVARIEPAPLASRAKALHSTMVYINKETAKRKH